MSHFYKLLSLYLWIAPHFFLIVIGVLLYRRGVHRAFPFFFLYVWYEIAEFALLFTISRIYHGVGYVTAFLITWVGSAALRFGVIHEVFNKVFSHDARVDVMSRAVLRWVSGSLLIGAVLLSFFASGQTSGSLIAGAALVGRGVAIIQCGLVVFLILFSNVLGMSFQSVAFGIALGFGIYSCADLANFAARTGDPSLAMVRMLNFLPTGGYHVAVLLWIGYLIVPKHQVIDSAPSYTSGQISRWSSEMERFLQ